MQRTPWALVTASLWVASLQGVRAEPSSVKAPAPQLAGPTNPATQLPAAGRTVQSALRRLDPSALTWRAHLAALPELRLYAPSFTTFGPTATDDALARGKRSRANIKNWQFVDGPFEWTLGGQLLWIVSGKTERGALLSVLAPSSAGPQHLASTVITEPDAVIAIGLSTERPGELLWTTCYGCPGQSGSIELAADGRPVFVYR